LKQFKFVFMSDGGSVDQPDPSGCGAGASARRARELSVLEGLTLQIAAHDVVAAARRVAAGMRAAEQSSTPADNSTDAS